MQKTGRGVYCQGENPLNPPAYLDAISDSLQKPIGGRVLLAEQQAHAEPAERHAATLNKGGIEKNCSYQPLQPEAHLFVNATTTNLQLETSPERKTRQTANAL